MPAIDTGLGAMMAQLEATCTEAVRARGLLGPAERWSAGTPAWGAPVPPGRFTQISAGGTGACGLRDDGSAACWGNLPLGDGCSVDLGQIRGLEGSFAEIQIDLGGVCARRSGGEVSCVGALAAPAGSFARIDVGSSYGCGVRHDGALDCWGTSEHGATEPGAAAPPEPLSLPVSAPDDALATLKRHLGGEPGAPLTVEYTLHDTSYGPAILEGYTTEVAALGYSTTRAGDDGMILIGRHPDGGVLEIEISGELLIVSWSRPEAATPRR